MCVLIHVLKLDVVWWRITPTLALLRNVKFTPVTEFYTLEILSNWTFNGLNSRKEKTKCHLITVNSLGISGYERVNTVNAE